MALSPQERSRRMRLNMLMAMSYAVAGRSAFTPLSLFSAGEVGAWYDPSDFSTMFQDSAGTTPVTAVEQPVGLILDKSKGLAVGSEIVTNGDFSSGTTGWTGTSSAVLSNPSGALVVTYNAVANPGVQGSGAVVAGAWYIVSYTVTAITNGTIALYVGSSNAGGAANLTAPGTKTVYIQATNTTPINIVGFGNTGSFTIDNVSVKRVSGNHASQTTSTSRPVLSARVNLLRYTEDFSNAAWVQAGSGTAAIGVKTNNYGTAPDGTTTAARIQLDVSAGSAGNQSQVYQAYPITVGVGYTRSVWMKTNDGSTKTIMGFSADGVASPSTISVTGTWTLFTNTRTPASGTNDNLQFILVKGTTSDTADLLVWHPDVRPTNQATTLPPYQRVGASTDYDTTGFPYYLAFDGTDDFLVTGTINPGSVDKAQVFAGVRKLSDAAEAIVAETSTSVITNNGSLNIFAPGGISVARDSAYVASSRGTTARYCGPAAATYSAPISNVVSALYNISGPSVSIRVNGTLAASETASQGTGNYLSNPLYVGSRAGTSNRFNGNLYGLIVRFSAANLSSETITKAETWLNTKTGAY